MLSKLSSLCKPTWLNFIRCCWTSVVNFKFSTIFCRLGLALLLNVQFPILGDPGAVSLGKTKYGSNDSPTFLWFSNVN